MAVGFKVAFIIVVLRRMFSREQNNVFDEGVIDPQDSIGLFEGALVGALSHEPSLRDYFTTIKEQRTYLGIHAHVSEVAGLTLTYEMSSNCYATKCELDSFPLGSCLMSSVRLLHTCNIQKKESREICQLAYHSSPS